MHKVLVIDDEAATLTMLRLFLGACGYTVRVAEDGRTGLDILEKEKPDIVLTDFKMPGMDGFEVLKRIKKTAPDTEVIVFTGYGDMDLVMQALALGATDFINKPINRPALNSALKRAEHRLGLGKDARTDDIQLVSTRRVAVIRIRGILTGNSRSRLQAFCNKAFSTETAGVVFSFDMNAEINGPGIVGLIQLLSELKKKRRPAVIAGLSENYQSIFKMVGVTRYAGLYNTEADAAAALVAK